MWQDGQFDVFLKEAQSCDKSLCNSFCSCANTSDDNLVKVFTKLMLQGNARAAAQWITERGGGGLLQPADSVLSDLQSKHPDPQVLLFPMVMNYLI